MTLTKQSSGIIGWKGVPFSEVKISDAFWRPRLETLKNVTIGVCLDQCEKTGRIANFALAGGLIEGKYEGMYYNDSDVYKVLEGAAYSLMTDRDPKLEAEIDRIVELIEAAQESDGYLSTYYTLEAPDLKWTDMEKHEMYNGGHLIEAAVAYYQATGKRKLLDVACRMADHYDSVFGPGKRHWAEGHEEIELALVKLFGATGEERYWKLALWLLEERGHGHGVGAIWDKEDWGPAYCQDDVPVKDIREVKGHAVRAMYLYTAMADVVLASGDPAYMEALDRVWAHTVERNMYVTGGIGPSVHNEGFTHDYDLPNESAYCETCAAIAMAFWNHRMNLLHGDGKYADIVERELFNGALSGISLSGDRFFYVNPLASKGEHHRVEWFHTSCCPTNLARFLPSIGQYIFAAAEDGISVNQYASSETTVKLPLGRSVQIAQSTAYPWDGKVELRLSPEQADEFTLRLRLPGWCRSYRVLAQGEPVTGGEALSENGYLALKRHWSPGDTVVLELDMPVAAVRSRQEVEANEGRIAFQRGPVVYCIEQTGNEGLVYDEFAIRASEPFVAEHRGDQLGGITVLRGRTEDGRPCELIPYYVWDNREAGFMQVWVREAEDRRLYR
ncbi:glycoside hydrolase family 127 protein [Paenibacillus glycanilyticus]|uniref:glycoside hydrolase family 127 protein n=1 Tax=Paenibacillus glycanilyticus TaxID=126569 RepID=UPI002041B28A|nr:beta-L-arabinofuranosidase domain-containing protein [Paenibacillus glycanilyticus]MCM3629022.1 glycoside hydrolase family 127 protein [Paenibacillus glycanilyticus]